MTLVLSYSEDSFTNDTIEWLLFHKEEFLRVNEYDDIQDVNVLIGNEDDFVEFTCRSQNLNSTTISFFWYRRGDLALAPIELPKVDSVQTMNDLQHFLNWEWKNLKGYFYNVLIGKNSLGNPLKSSVNKLNTLLIAREVGLKIPQSHIFNKLKVEKFESVRFITKPISEIVPVKNEGSHLRLSTKIVDSSILTDLKLNSAFISLLQHNIEKWIELRVFYMYGQFYSMAIFSQFNSSTTIDYRDLEPNMNHKSVPYQLPIDIEEKLHKLLEKMELDTASIDLIVTPEREYVFLEVNPEGLIDMVNQPCNYYLEREVASEIRKRKKHQ